jgi:hypothetical protein
MRDQHCEYRGGQNGNDECNEHVENQGPKLLSHELYEKSLGRETGLPDKRFKKYVTLHHQENHKEKKSCGNQGIQDN